MKKRRYAGILALPIIQDGHEESARQKALEALFAFYGIAEPFTDAGWKKLAEALAAAHVPAFSPQRRSKQQHRPIGNKPKLSSWDLLHAAVLVLQLFHRGMSMRRACDIVWRSREGYFKPLCSLETFRQNVSAIARIPRDKLFDYEPGDKPVVKRFKSDLRRLESRRRHRPGFRGRRRGSGR